MTRPNVVTVFGIVNLSFALIYLCGLAALSSPVLALKEGSEPADPLYAPLLQHPVFLVYTKVSMMVGGVLSVLLAASGVGLLLMKSWGRRLAVFYSAFSSVLGALGLLLYGTVYMPAVLEHAQKMPEGPSRTALVVGAQIGIVLSGLCGLLYPIVLLICMTRPRFVALFGTQLPDTGPPAADAPPAN